MNKNIIEGGKYKYMIYTNTKNICISNDAPQRFYPNSFEDLNENYQNARRGDEAILPAGDNNELTVAVFYDRWILADGNKYNKITYNLDESNIYAIDFVKTDDIAVTPISPEAPEGKQFAAWMENDVEFDFETPITEDITLIAKFDPIV